MKHISITGDLGSGKSSVAKILCQQLGFEYFSTGSLQRKLAAEKGMNTLDMNKFSESTKDVDDYIDNHLRNIEADPHPQSILILDSRLAWHFVPSSFKVFIKVDPRVAAQRVLADKVRSNEPDNKDVASTMASLKERMQSECRRFKEYYDIDYRNEANYDLVIDSSEQSAQAVATAIIRAYFQLSAADLAQIAAKGISLQQLARQLRCFETGFPYLPLAASASTETGGGIRRFSQDEEQRLLAAWDAYLQTEHQVLKFVPASGAASRMFKDLFAFLDAAYQAPTTDFEKTFCAHVEYFAFSEELDTVCRKNQGKSLHELAENGEYKQIVRNLLLDEGLRYGSLPKGLLSFHRYPEGSRKAVAEHMVEGALYTRDKHNQVNLHFTVSPEHRQLFEAEVARCQAPLEAQYGVHYHISFSEQKPSTDTIAADAANRPFRDKGKLLFRPGGHGALIENLNDLQADIVFIKNIDNVVPDRLKDCTVHYKKVLAGLLVSLQEKAFAYLRLLDSGKYSHDDLVEIIRFVQQQLFTRKDDIKDMEDGDLVVYLKGKLNRPMRVCGMVRNQGEPGGGPFMVYNPDGSKSLQILESSQIDMNDPEKVAMFKQGSHFNPVDLVCALKNYKGEAFDLPSYVDAKTGFISNKSKNGQELKALELPGLWNGAMSNWNTVFVEVPIDTFNPVKTVNDLLRVQHQ